MEREVKLSVIVTVFNLEHYVGAALDAVLTQTQAPFEVIVVDDASTDRSADVLARYASRVRILTLPVNGGVLRATLAGVRASTGDVICFLDGDDLWHSEKLAEVSAVFRARPDVLLVSHDYRMIDGAGRVLREDDGTQVELCALARDRDYASIDTLMRRSILEYRGNVWLGSAWSIRRTDTVVREIEDWAGKLATPEFTYQDHPLAVLLCLRAPGQLAYVDRKLLDYRAHSSNHSGGTDMTPERWMRVVRKAWTTAHVTRDLVHKYGDAAALRRQEGVVAEYDFLLATGARNWRDAWRAYRYCSRHRWSLRESAREALRAVAIAALGAQRALEIKAHLASARRR